MKELVQTTAKHLYGIEPGRLVRRKQDGTVGKIVEVTEQGARVAWKCGFLPSEPLEQQVCFGDLEVVSGQESEVP